MINITQGGWDWDLLDDPTECPHPDVWETPPEQLVSPVLGPDGQPLVYDLQRPRIGFDLRTAAQRAQDEDDD